MNLADLNDLDVGRIWAGAGKILAEIGLQVANEKIRQGLKGKLPLKDGRARIPTDVAEQYAEEIRRRFGAREARTGAGQSPDGASYRVQRGA